MLLIDSRVGSKELAPLFRSPTCLSRLEFGDVSFTGIRDGAPILVGVERKTVADFLNGVLSGRTVGHQLRGLLNHYTVSYIVVEGLWRASPEGTLEVPQRGGWTPVRFGARTFSASLLYSHITTLEVLGGVYVRQTRGKQDTADLVEALRSWWSREPDEHTSHLQINCAAPAMRTPDHRLRMRQPTTAVRVAAQLPHVGSQLCWDVANHFNSVRNMANASEEEWRELPRVGRKKAADIVGAISDGGKD